MSENLWFCDVFRRCKNGTLGQNGLKLNRQKESIYFLLSLVENRNRLAALGYFKINKK